MAALVSSPSLSFECRGKWRRLSLAGLVLLRRFHLAMILPPAPVCSTRVCQASCVFLLKQPSLTTSEAFLATITRQAKLGSNPSVRICFARWQKKIGKIMASFSELVCLAPDTRSVGNDEGYQLAASLICVEAATPAARAQCPYSPHGAHTASTHTARTQRPNSTHKAPTPARAERPYSAHAAPTHANTDREYRLAPVSETS